VSHWVVPPPPCLSDLRASVMRWCGNRGAECRLDSTACRRRLRRDEGLAPTLEGQAPPRCPGRPSRSTPPSGESRRVGCAYISEKARRRLRGSTPRRYSRSTRSPLPTSLRRSASRGRGKASIVSRTIHARTEASSNSTTLSVMPRLPAPSRRSNGARARTLAELPRGVLDQFLREVRRPLLGRSG
jgi:hypothetical protein